MNNDAQIITPFPWFFFLLAFTISWLIWLPGILSTVGLIKLPVPFIVFFFIGTWGPFLAALWVINRDGGSIAIISFWKRGWDFHFPKTWQMIIVGLVLLVSILPIGIHVLLGGPKPEFSLLAKPWLIIPVFLTYFFVGGGNEEWGWRGYTLDKLQTRWNPTFASIILGIIWGAWHIPLFFIDSTGQYHMSLFVFILATPGLSILHTWIYNKTGGKMMATWIFHAAIGTAWEVFPIIQPKLAGYQNVYIYDFIAVTILAIIVLLIDGFSLGKNHN